MYNLMPMGLSSEKSQLMAEDGEKDLYHFRRVAFLPAVLSIGLFLGGSTGKSVKSTPM